MVGVRSVHRQSMQVAFMYAGGDMPSPGGWRQGARTQPYRSLGNWGNRVQFSRPRPPTRLPLRVPDPFLCPLSLTSPPSERQRNFTRARTYQALSATCLSPSGKTKAWQGEEAVADHRAPCSKVGTRLGLSLAARARSALPGSSLPCRLLWGGRHTEWPGTPNCEQGPHCPQTARASGTKVAEVCLAGGVAGYRRSTHPLSLGLSSSVY